MKRLISIILSLFVISVLANAQSSQKQSTTGDPISYKLGNLYDSNGRVIKGQKNVIAYIGSDNYFNVYQKAHKNYRIGAIVFAAGVGMLAGGMASAGHDESAPGTMLWSWPVIGVGAGMFLKSNGKLKQLAKKYNYNQGMSLSFGLTNKGVGLTYSF